MFLPQAYLCRSVIELVNPRAIPNETRTTSKFTADGRMKLTETQLIFSSIIDEIQTNSIDSITILCNVSFFK